MIRSATACCCACGSLSSPCPGNTGSSHATFQQPLHRPQRSANLRSCHQQGATAPNAAAAAAGCRVHLARHHSPPLQHTPPWNFRCSKGLRISGIPSPAGSLRRQRHHDDTDTEQQRHRDSRVNRIEYLHVHPEQWLVERFRHNDRHVRFGHHPDRQCHREVHLQRFCNYQGQRHRRYRCDLRQQCVNLHRQLYRDTNRHRAR